MDSSAVIAPCSYQDFNPKSEWIREEGADKLIELPDKCSLLFPFFGFRKENLIVQLYNFRNLRTSGERALKGNVSHRFYKEFRVPENCNTGQIRTKFENCILTIILQKFTSEDECVPAPVTQAPQPQEKRKYGVEGLRMQMKTRPLLINIIIAVLVLVGVKSYVDYKFRQMAEAEARETLNFDEL